MLVTLIIVIGFKITNNPLSVLHSHKKTSDYIWPTRMKVMVLYYNVTFRRTASRMTVFNHMHCGNIEV